MTIHEFFIQQWEREQPAFSKVMRAIPEDKHSYKPHDVSKTAAELAWQMVQEQRSLLGVFTKGEVRMDEPPLPKKAEEIADAWDKATSDLRIELKKLDEKSAAGPADFYMGGQKVWTDTAGGMLWGFLFDLIHHRGQLSTYLRPMGGKVPAIYGPSADDTGA